jgi:hypothetical protein
MNPDQIAQTLKDAAALVEDGLRDGPLGKSLLAEALALAEGAVAALREVLS